MFDAHRLPALLLVLVFLATGSAAFAQDEPAADLKVSRSLAKRLAKDLVSGKDKRVKAARRMLLRTRSEDRKHVFTALETAKRKPPRRKNRKERVIHQTLPLTHGGQRDGEFLIHLPKKYNGKKPYPLLYRLHGSGGSADSYKRGWESNSLADRFIAVTPTVPSPDRQAWNQPGGGELLDKIYGFMLRNYNVDTDRVYFSGYSAGGGASFLFAQIWPERIAAIFSRSRVYPKFDRDWNSCMAMMRWIPGFYQVGLGDREDRVSGYRKVEAYFKKHDFTAEFNFVEGRGHEYMAEYDKAGYGYLLKHRRKNYPKSFSAMFFDYTNWTDGDRARNGEQYWLRGKRFQPNGTPVQVKAEGNTIQITGRIAEGSVLLNDHLVDLDQPVTVVVNGREAFQGKVERSIEFLLAGYDRVPDPRRMFWNEVPFKAGSAPVPPSGGPGKIKPKSGLGKIKPPGEARR